MVEKFVMSLVPATRESAPASSPASRPRPRLELVPPPKSTHTPDEALTELRDAIPGFLHATLVLLPEEMLIGSVDLESMFDGELLVRAACRCLGAPNPDGDAPGREEHTFVSSDRFVLIQRSHLDPRLALALSCSRDVNLQFSISSTRAAFRALEATLDWSAWQE